jgi:hypothetical protein
VFVIIHIKYRLVQVFIVKGKLSIKPKTHSFLAKFMWTAFFVLFEEFSLKIYPSNLDRHCKCKSDTEIMTVMCYGQNRISGLFRSVTNKARGWLFLFTYCSVIATIQHGFHKHVSFDLRHPFLTHTFLIARRKNLRVNNVLTLNLSPKLFPFTRTLITAPLVNAHAHTHTHTHNKPEA